MLAFVWLGWLTFLSPLANDYPLLR